MYFQNLISFLLTSLIILSWHPFDREFLFIHFVQQNEPGFICLTSSLIKGFFFSSSFSFLSFARFKCWIFGRKYQIGKI